MKKALIFIAVFIVAAAVFAAGGEAYAAEVYIDSEKVVFDAQTGYPFVENGRTFVPLRAAAEAFGAEVMWDDETKSAIITVSPVSVTVTVGEMCVYRNGVKIPNDAAAVIRDARTYLPIRAVFEALGAEVGWDGNVRVETAYGKFVKQVESGGTSSRQFWNSYNQAIQNKNAGNYADALNGFLNCGKMFVAKEEAASKAMLFLNLGDCYSALRQYENAKFCYRREAYYWGFTTDSESVAAANRRASLTSEYVQMYIKAQNPNYSVRKYFAEALEPQYGVLLGACVPMSEVNTFDNLAGKSHAAYLQYMEYGATLHDVVEGFEGSDKIVQIHLQPMNGLSEVKCDDYLIGLAIEMENSPLDFMLRFAGEMNDTSNERWYDPDPTEFIRAFRTVAEVFHEYAPSVPVVWAPNFYPQTNYTDYYPGDAYVDYVGISSYKTYLGEVDPLGEGIDRSRWSNQLDKLYSIYGMKKPFVVVEGNAESYDYWTSTERSDFAVAQLSDFYTYAPIRYPNLKAIFIYNNRDTNNHYQFKFDDNPAVLTAYRGAIWGEQYLSGREEKILGSWYELGENVAVEGTASELCAYIVHPTKTPAYVVYRINGADVGAAYGVPYSVSVDLSPYKGQSVNVSCLAFDAAGAIMSETSYNLKCE